MTTVVPPRLLCVDDDASVLAGLRRQLRGRYEVVLAQGASEGLARLRDAGPFAAIVSDLHMPGVDGRAFLSAARTLAPRAVAVLMTGSMDAEPPIDAGLGDLVFRRIEKPFGPDVLWAALDAAIAHHAERGDA
jgi:DNA-binding NtrC family response regulator